MIKVLIIISSLLSLSFSNPTVRIIIPKKVKVKTSKTNLKKLKKHKLTILSDENTLNKKRRITKLEKKLISSKRAKKIKFEGRTVVKRRVYNCNKENISLMLQGKAPIGFDNKRVNLHHLKQQQMGNLVELSQTEHTMHSKVLHRYTKTSDIVDRNSGYMKFRQKWWKSRASSCISRGL